MPRNTVGPNKPWEYKVFRPIEGVEIQCSEDVHTFGSVDALPQRAGLLFVGGETPRIKAPDHEPERKWADTGAT